MAVQFPLMSKSRKLHELITEQETNPTRNQSNFSAEEELGDEIEQEQYCHISLPDFPGGSETLETAAKFCYGVKIELSASNVAPLRCAGEFLEMTEEYSEDNLISRTERHLSQSVLRSVKDSLKTLKSCERLTPLAETLGIPQRCIEAVAERALSADPSLFGWPVNDGRGSSNVLWNGIETGVRRKGTSRVTSSDSWLEDLALLSLPLFKRLILAMRARDLSPDVLESCLMYYAKKYIPGISRSNRKPPSSSVVSENEQRELMETIITNLPSEKSSRSSTATRFLFGLLRTANILNASEASRAALERKIGSQLEQATLDDLLIPSYSYLNETLYDVDCVERILGYFLDGLEAEIESEVGDGSVRPPTMMLVGKLIDGYLSEIASDANLKPDKFYELAIALPDNARLFDDGLYRAVDVYLKVLTTESSLAFPNMNIPCLDMYIYSFLHSLGTFLFQAHPWMAEEEREKICGVMNCQKLTLEACTHAAQNERLPLRAVVQVLFFEQLQLRHAIAGSILAAESAPADSGRPSNVELEQEGESAVAAADSSTSTWRAAVRENQVLRLDMDSMRSRVHELERECSTMKKAIEKIDQLGASGGWRGSLTKRFGCKFKTQVCDSHEPTTTTTVVETRKTRHHHHHLHHQ